MSNISSILSNHLIACVDLEATCCDDNSFPRSDMEIIEFGCTIVDPQDEYKVVATYDTFVRPVVYPQLTEFCKTLTTITQADVDSAQTWLELHHDMKTFFEDVSHHTGRPIAWVSWGDYDRNQIAKDNARWFIGTPQMPIMHFNLKRLDASWRNTTKERGLRGAIQHLGLSFPGTLHRAKDDAAAVAMVLKAIGPGLIRSKL